MDFTTLWWILAFTPTWTLVLAYKAVKQSIKSRQSARHDRKERPKEGKTSKCSLS
jgi:hypothetical protein